MTNHDEVTEIDIPETDDKRTSLPDRAGAAMALAVDGKQPIASVFVGRAALHPFVFRKRVERIEGSPRAGHWVAVYSLEKPDQPQLFAYGLYNDRSEIAVRLVRWWGEIPDEAFWQESLQRAVSLRHDVLKLNQTADTYRLIHAESDGFPGLMIDRYGDVLSAEVFSYAMYYRAQAILEKLGAMVGTQHWLIQPSPLFLSQEGYDATIVKSPSLPSFVTVQENGVKFRVHFATGHKTGFFCDQRENRLQLSEFCRDKSVLDLCCYSGGFSVYAAKRGQASEVTGVDLDAEPLQLAKKNCDINQTRVRYVQSDAFAFMRDMIRLGKQYEVVVLDPPKLIRSRAELEEGTKKHFDLNKLAMQLVKPGGIMLSCSCAGLLGEAEFSNVIRSAAKATGFDEAGKSRPPRTVQVLAKHGAAADHPVVVHCPETEYLKSIWMRVW